MRTIEDYDRRDNLQTQLALVSCLRKNSEAQARWTLDNGSKRHMEHDVLYGRSPELRVAADFR